MTLGRLAFLVVFLSICIGLVLLNPSKDDYLKFVETELKNAMDRSAQVSTDRDMAVVRSIFRSHSRELVGSFVGPRTIRRNWGLVSMYESRVFETEVLVLGVCGRFIPLKGVDDAILRLGRMAF